MNNTRQFLGSLAQENWLANLKIPSESVKLIMIK